MTVASTRDALLDAAEAAIRVGGHAGFSYGDLSAEVGLRKASIHHHFPKKDDMLAAVALRYGEKLRGALAALETWHEDAPLRRLGDLAGIYRAPVASGAGLCVCVALSSGQEELRVDARDAVRAARRDVIAFLTRALAELEKAPVDAAGFLALLEGGQIAARISGDVADFDRALARVFAALNNAD